MTTQTHILLVEDDPEIAALVSAALGRGGFRVTHLDSGAGVFQTLEFDPPDLILLDLLLPGETGTAIARRIRAAHVVPIIMMTAMAEERDRISGLDLGADDYVTKPFSTPELIARIKAVLRRTGPNLNGPKPAVAGYRFAGWHLNIRTRELTDPDSARVEVTSAEFEILRIFCEHSGEVLSRDKLMLMAQGRKVEPYDRGVDTMVSRVRSKVEPLESSPSLIKTVRHSGYVFTPDVTVIPA
jgi:two-component system OmpR family response regulator